MKTIISRTAIAALLATSIGAGFAALTPAAALAQMSPASPNYTYDNRNKTAAFGGETAYASVPAAQSQYRGGLSARDSVIDDGSYLGQDTDANVRLQLRRDDGLFDR